MPLLKKKKQGLPVQSAGFMPPLFDRLTQGPIHLLDMQGLRQSVQQEISLMLASRSDTAFLAVGKEQEKEDSLPQPILLHNKIWETFWADSQEQSIGAQIERHLEACIRSFEPRLHNPSVRIEQVDSKAQSLTLHIQGTLQMEEHTEIMSFPLVIQEIERFAS